jgi:hypothetical protein
MQISLTGYNAAFAVAELSLHIMQIFIPEILEAAPKGHERLA